MPRLESGVEPGVEVANIAAALQGVLTHPSRLPAGGRSFPHPFMDLFPHRWPCCCPMCPRWRSVRRGLFSWTKSARSCGPSQRPLCSCSVTRKSPHFMPMSLLPLERTRVMCAFKDLMTWQLRLWMSRRGAHLQALDGHEPCRGAPDPEGS